MSDYVASQDASDDGLSIYIHIPWCERKCPYCDFNSHALGERDYWSLYREALIQDFEASYRTRKNALSVKSIFFGGGTPSLFPLSELRVLMDHMRCRIPSFEENEITIEANPNSLSVEKLTAYLEYGFNRISIGVQSLQDKHLKTLGRLHSASEAIDAVNNAITAGFKNINIDLMYGLPNQTSAEALCDLKQACELAPSHLSWYQLAIEPNTFFFHNPPPLPQDDAVARMEDKGYDFLNRAGFTRYEISAYANTDHMCQHNCHYWQFGDYLGIGAGAHGKETLQANKEIRRFMRERNPVRYMRGVLASKKSYEQSIVAIKDIPFEFMMNALRLHHGVPESLFLHRTGLSLDSIEKPLSIAEQRGLLHRRKGRIIPTELGRRHLNDLILLFC